MRRLHRGVVLLLFGFLVAACGPSKSSGPEKAPEPWKPADPSSVSAKDNREVRQAVEAMYADCKSGDREKALDHFIVAESRYKEQVSKIALMAACLSGDSVSYEMVATEQQDSWVRVLLVHKDSKGQTKPKEPLELTFGKTPSGWKVVAMCTANCDHPNK